MTYFHKLNIPHFGHPPGFTLPVVRAFGNTPRNTDSWTYKIEEVMDRRTIDFFGKECQLVFDVCLIFFVRAGFSTNIHIDGSARAVNVWAVNFNQDGIGSKINWYNKTSVRPTITLPHLGNAKVDTWEEKDLTLAQSYTVDHDKLLIRTDSPHKIINCTDTSRWCFSFRGAAQKHRIKSRDEIVKSLRKYI